MKSESIINYFILSAFVLLIICASCDNNSVRPDTSYPKITIKNPIHGERIDTTTTIAVDIIPHDAIEKVAFYVDGELIGTDDEWPFEKVWYVGFWAEDSIHTIFVESTDTSGTTAKSNSLNAIVDPSAIIIPEIIYPEDGCVITEPGLFIIQLYCIEGATEYYWQSHMAQIHRDYFTCYDEICYSTEYTYHSGCKEVNWRLYIHTPGKTILRRYTYYVAIGCGE